MYSKKNVWKVFTRGDTFIHARLEEDLNAWLEKCQVMNNSATDRAQERNLVKGISQ